MKKIKQDIFEMVSHFQKNLLENRPPVDQMFQEVRMMKFKVRPLQGDISFLNLHDTHFIEVLWSLGKLDEFFQFHIEKLSKDQRDIFFRLLDELYQKFQSELNTIDLKREQSTDFSSGFEMEIYKDKTPVAN